LKVVKTKFGPKEKFNFVFEIPLTRQDGSRYRVWSYPLSLSYHESSALRPFLRKWMGRELAPQEVAKFDTDQMVGVPALISVIHEHSNGKTYANIANIQPCKSDEPPGASGSSVRVKDPPPNNGGSAAAVAQESPGKNSDDDDAPF
jgi:hypothetical protein